LNSAAERYKCSSFAAIPTPSADHFQVYTGLPYLMKKSADAITAPRQGKFESDRGAGNGRSQLLPKNPKFKKYSARKTPGRFSTGSLGAACGRLARPSVHFGAMSEFVFNPPLQPRHSARSARCARRRHISGPAFIRCGVLTRERVCCGRCRRRQRPMSSASLRRDSGCGPRLRAYSSRNSPQGAIVGKQSPGGAGQARRR
jgi:hypothetical protein